jgi:hypothetical protein
MDLRLENMEKKQDLMLNYLQKMTNSATQSSSVADTAVTTIAEV